MIKKIALVLLGALIVIQFFRPQRNESEMLSTDITQGAEVPVDVQAILKNKCYDCHSNNTNYPWYYYVQPVAWWMADHIEHGKSHLNFSEFLSYDAEDADHALEEIGEVVEEDEMPIDSYLIMHPDARLTSEEKEALLRWVEQLRQ